MRTELQSDVPSAHHSLTGAYLRTLTGAIPRQVGIALVVILCTISTEWIGLMLLIPLSVKIESRVRPWLGWDDEVESRCTAVDAVTRHNIPGMIHMTFIALWLAVIVTIFPAVELSAQTAPAPPVPPMLSPGDSIRITVWNKPELSGQFPVAADSSIAHPFYMDVKVAGMPLSNAGVRVREQVARVVTDSRDLQVLVEPLFRVSIGGEVRQPNLYSFRPETTIAQAVMRAGGYTERARINHVRLWRDGQELGVDLSRPDVGFASVPIRSGDQILVPRKVSILRDYVAPVSSVLAATAAITNFILRTF